MNYWKTVCFACGLVLVTAVSSAAQTFTTLASFGDEFTIFSAFVQGRDGNLYGTAIDFNVDDGSVLKVTPSGALTVLYRFCAQPNCTDGSSPFSALALGTDGNFYGTTQNGGASGLGVVFKITPEGALTVIHSFDGTVGDGSSPDAGLVLGTDGNLYGTTFSGGANSEGTVFKITPTGTLTLLHSFDGADGLFPDAPLVQGTDGNFYGTTYEGGNQINSCYSGGCGTVFKITPGGRFAMLHAFDFTDGATLYTPLVQASDGSFYGTTFLGEDSRGTIFRINSQGTVKTIHRFEGLSENPIVGLATATDGNLYGTTLGGGGCDSDAGSIYKVSQTGIFSTVFGCQNGGYEDAVVQNTNGTFYGAYTYEGGEIYSLGTGLGPFVGFVVPAGKPGHTAQILGQGLTGTTSVIFNGVPASSFSVLSDTFMTAVVPSGATTGKVVVTTPGGVLSSNVNFRISE